MIGLDARMLCVRTLIRSIRSKSYSNLALTQAVMDAENLSPQDSALCRRIFRGTFDVRASDGYDGSEAAKPDEYEKLKKRYNVIWYSAKNANKDGQVVDGLTFWGTVDHYSWLQSRSNVGGGSTTGLPQCPLLFDEHYEPKPCFYVFAGSDE